MDDNAFNDVTEKEEEGLVAQGGGCTRFACIICMVGTLIVLGTGLGVAFGVESTGLRSWASELGKGSSSSSVITSAPIGSMSPSDQPSFAPSDGPSVYPSMNPSTEPTIGSSANPTLEPTPMPTAVYYPANPEPSSPPNTYFNYNPNSEYGPPNWNRVNTGDHWVSL